MHARLLGRRQIHRADAFDRDLAALALDVLEADEAGLEIEACRPGAARSSVDEELVAARGRDCRPSGSLHRSSGADSSSVLPVTDCELVAAPAAGRVSVRSSPCVTADVDERHHAHVRFVERDERHDLRERATSLTAATVRAVAHRPPHFRRRRRDRAWLRRRCGRWRRCGA